MVHPRSTADTVLNHGVDRRDDSEIHVNGANEFPDVSQLGCEPGCPHETTHAAHHHGTRGANDMSKSAGQQTSERSHTHKSHRVKTHHAMAKIGLDRIGGWFAVDALAGWSATRGPLEQVTQVTPAAIAERVAAGAVTVIDVRLVLLQRGLRLNDRLLERTVVAEIRPCGFREPAWRKLVAQVANDADRQLMLVFRLARLVEIRVAARLDLETARAFPARVKLHLRPRLAEKRLGELRTNLSLPIPSRPGEEKRMREPPFAAVKVEASHHAVMTSQVLPRHVQPREERACSTAR